MDCLREWPEPVVPVQSLSASDTIPARYIKPPSQRPAGKAAASAVLAGVPVVDLGVAAEAAPAVVSAACGEWGVFQVVNHGVSPELLRRFRAAWRGFFRLPMEEKRRHANSPATYEGYGSRLGVEPAAALDWSDYYFLHLLPPRLKDHSKWPSLPPCLRETMEEYGEEVLKLCRRLMAAMSAGLGLAGDRLQKAFGGGEEEDEGVCVRVNFYPRCPQPELALGLSPHSDPGGMTVLLAEDDVLGLQVRLRDGSWVDVEPIHDAFIVNIGDQIEVLSNGRYKSVEHRVTVSAEHDRLSVAFFYNPRSDVPIGPIPELAVQAAAAAALYRTMTFDEYRVLIRREGTRGKSSVESLKLLGPPDDDDR